MYVEYEKCSVEVDAAKERNKTKKGEEEEKGEQKQQKQWNPKNEMMKKKGTILKNDEG
jgi:hypothetical protein